MLSSATVRSLYYRHVITGYCPPLEVIDQPGCDVFGNTIQMLRKPVECVCPSCNRTLGASKFAPHLEKCLGMGRGRSRLAHKRTVAVETEGEGSEDNEEEWTYPEKKCMRHTQHS